MPLPKPLNSSLLPDSLFWQSDAALSPCSQLLGFESSKISLWEPELPSQLSSCQPSRSNSCVPKAIKQAVFTPYLLLCVWGGYHTKDTPVSLALAFAVSKDHVAHSGVSVVAADLKDCSVRDEPDYSSSGEPI